MDLLIETSTQSVRLSTMNILTVDFDESTPSVTTKAISFSGRNGKLNFGGDYSEKKISLVGYLYASSQSDYETKRNALYGLLGSAAPFYVTPYFDSTTAIAYQNPGETTGETLKLGTGTKSNKRFNVILDDVFQPEFAGNINGRLVYKLTMNFVTAVLPFGETVAKTTTLGTSLTYNGTAPASQLEVPFYVEVTASATASAISLKIGDREWTYNGTVASGDVFRIGGVYNLKNGLSVNDNTNYQYFILKPGSNAVVSSVAGKITINNWKELYL